MRFVKIPAILSTVPDQNSVVIRKRHNWLARTLHDVDLAVGFSLVVLLFVTLVFHSRRSLPSRRLCVQ